jgi:hypothetical protein
MSRSLAFCTACLLALAFELSPAFAWVSLSRNVVSRQQLSVLDALFSLNANSGDNSVSRRSFVTAAMLISTSTIACTIMPPPAQSAASAAEPQGPTIDPLVAFGEQLQKTDIGQKWPQEAAHPLPSISGSTPPPPATAAPVVVSDIEAALENAKAKKQVDPRTHG